MRINLLQPILDYLGQPTKDETGKEFTIRNVFSIALNAPPLPTDAPQTAENKAKVFQLSVKLFKDKEVDFTVDELAFLKEMAGKNLSPIAYGRVCEIIEGKPQVDN